MSTKNIASFIVMKLYVAISIDCASVTFGVIVVILRVHFYVLPLTFNSPFILRKDWKLDGD
ncbi:MAG: hypothetical protein ACLP9S_06365 [Syntrophales bacterium]